MKTQQEIIKEIEVLEERITEDYSTVEDRAIYKALMWCIGLQERL